MSVQITVRIPDRLADFMDGVVERGEASSRAEVVSRALLTAWRRQRDEADLEIIKEFAGAHANPGASDLADLD
jgi:Arc/MetJ-type ribon-helix-helix transcriptional regulator